MGPRQYLTPMRLLSHNEVTTAALIQNQSLSGGIHLSEATAILLMKAGKSNWVMEREDKIVAAEKGELKTYWLVKGGLHAGLDHLGHSVVDSVVDSEGDASDDLEGQQRWIEWNVEVFKALLKQIIAKNATLPRGGNFSMKQSKVVSTIPLEEVQEIIKLPEFDKKGARRQRENADMEIPEKVVNELRAFISAIADHYNPNPFHNVSEAIERYSQLYDC
jgi:hypothetical protein